MTKIIYRVDVMGTMRAMNVGDYLMLPFSENIPEITIRASATKLKPMEFSVNKTADGFKVTRNA